MPRKIPYRLIKTNCPRCGKEVYSSSRSLHGANQAHAKYAGICSACITPAERDDMQRQIAGAALHMASK